MLTDLVCACCCLPVSVFVCVGALCIGDSLHLVSYQHYPLSAHMIIMHPLGKLRHTHLSLTPKPPRPASVRYSVTPACWAGG